MSITIGRKHGNGYHDSVYCKTIIEFSERVKDLLDYEKHQLEEHAGIIYEQKFLPSWVERVCIRCPLTYPPKYMAKKRESLYMS